MRSSIKKIIIAVLTILILFFIVRGVSEPILLGFIKANLEKTFSGSTVDISSCKLGLVVPITIDGVRITKGKELDIKINRCGAKFDVFSIVNRRIDSLFFDGITADITKPEETLIGYINKLNTAGGFFKILGVSVRNSNVNVNFKDFKGGLDIGFSYDFELEYPEFVNLNIKDLSWPDGEIKNLVFKARQRAGNRVSYAEKIKYGKLELANFKGETKFIKNQLVARGIKFNLFNGEFSGDFFINFEEDPIIKIKFTFNNLNLGGISKTYEFDNKFYVSGFADGYIYLIWRNQKIATFDARMAINAGGDLNVVDENLIKNIANNTNSDYNILINGLKNYYFEAGSIITRSNYKDVELIMRAEGSQGKRDILIVFHDVNFKKLFNF